MKKFDLYSFPGKLNGEGENERLNKLLASPNSKITAPDFALGLVVIEPGKGHEIHQHSAHREIIVVVEGEVIMHQEEGDEGIRLKKGDFIGFDFNEPHGFRNISDKTLYMLWIYYPPGEAEDKFLIKDKEE